MDPNPAKKPPSRIYLFGGSKPWRLTDWLPSNDTLRGGTSTSHLLIAAASPSDPHAHPAAIFTGTLDTRTLGGAGFASQRTASPDLGFDLSPYDAGLEVAIGQADRKRYTLILKDEIPPARGDGREGSGVSWEAGFVVARERGEGEREGGGKHDVVLRLRWKDFKAMYRGREIEGAGELNRAAVKRVAIMCRSFFGEQEGEFELVIRSIAAVKGEEGEEEREVRYRDDLDAELAMEGEDEKRLVGVSVRKGWLDWMLGACVKL